MTRLRSTKGRSAGRLTPCVRSSGAASIFVLSVLAAIFLALFLAWFSPTGAQAAPDTTTSSLYLYGPARSQVDALIGQAGAVQTNINTLDDQLELATENYNHLTVKLDQLNVRMADLRRQLAEAQTEHDRRVRGYEDRIRGVSMAGGRDKLLQMLLLADGVEDLFKRIRVISKLADQDTKLVDNLKESTDALSSLLKEIDEHKREELSIRREMDDQRAQIEAKLAERQGTLTGIGKQIDQVIAQERIRQQQEKEQVRQALLALLDGGQH